MMVELRTLALSLAVLVAGCSKQDTADTQNSGMSASDSTAVASDGEPEAPRDQNSESSVAKAGRPEACADKAVTEYLSGEAFPSPPEWMRFSDWESISDGYQAKLSNINATNVDAATKTVTCRASFKTQTNSFSVPYEVTPDLSNGGLTIRGDRTGLGVVRSQIVDEMMPAIRKARAEFDADEAPSGDAGNEVTSNAGA